MNSTMNDAEREWVGRVKEQPCSVCSAHGPSEAHHIEQGLHFTVVALCPSCHRDSIMGLHGQKRMWLITKMTEMDALNTTILHVFKALKNRI